MHVDGSGGGDCSTFARTFETCATGPIGCAKYRYSARTSIGTPMPRGVTRIGLPSETTLRTHSGATCAV